MSAVERPKSFLAAATQGKGEGWRYLLVILGLGWVWWNISGDAAFLSQNVALWLFHSPVISVAVGTLTPFCLILVLLVLAIYVVHERPLHTLINAETSINFKRLWLGFGAWMLLSMIFGIPYVWIYPQDYAFTFRPEHWFTTLPIFLLLTPLQTSTEELFYRGYLMQGLSLLTKHPVVLTIATSLAFAIPHFGNPEMQRGFIVGALIYLLWGIFFAVISLKDNGLELALGAHAANNLFLDLFINTPDSILPTPSIWTFTGPIHVGEGLMGLLFRTMFFYVIFFGGIPRHISFHEDNGLNSQTSNSSG